MPDSPRSVSAASADAWEREEADRERRGRLKLVETLAADLGPRYSPARASLDSFQVRDGKTQAPVVARLRQLAGRLDKLTADGVGLIFLGRVGTGKDHLAAALLYIAAREFGLDSRWVNARSTFQQSRDAMAQDRTEADLIRPLVKPSILCLSDPLPIAGTLSAWNVDLLYRLVDERYRQYRPTWVTMNAESADEADDRLSPPVWDRLRDQAEVIECKWESWRKERRT